MRGDDSGDRILLVEVYKDKTAQQEHLASTHVLEWRGKRNAKTEQVTGVMAFSAEDGTQISCPHCGSPQELQTDTASGVRGYTCSNCSNQFEVISGDVSCLHCKCSNTVSVLMGYETAVPCARCWQPFDVINGTFPCAQCSADAPIIAVLGSFPVLFTCGECASRSQVDENGQVSLAET
eukprot:CAMPEP_0117603596 /NCGR_PEP_ID=MMETSP0784-20121206/78234_1 /TAXON_ID=39447 /ORGANISM="" /LENGTH=178 /DNA_ID=CAMNT_0005406563 /DNA_START=34 /DNA_END=570 /DNA_ORIENTATION=-